MSELWPKGVGRIKREPYVLVVGAERIDIDELRTHHVHTGRLYDALVRLSPPPTAPEVLWMSDFLHGMLCGVRKEAMQRLMEILMNKQPRPEITAEKVRATVLHEAGFEPESFAQEPGNTTIKDMGLDSLEIQELVFTLEDEFGITIGDTDITNESTLDQIVALCIERGKAT